MPLREWFVFLDMFWGKSKKQYYFEDFEPARVIHTPKVEKDLIYK